SRFQQIHKPRPAGHEILKVAGLLDDEPKLLTADLDFRVASALSLAATQPGFDFESSRFRNGELPFRPIVRIDPITEAVLVRSRFVAQHDAVRCGVARE